MEILTMFIMAGGAIICFRIAANTLQDVAECKRLAHEATMETLAETFLPWTDLLKATQKRVEGIDLSYGTEPAVKLLEVVTARLQPEVQRTKGEPMPASLISWIHTWPDQWAIDQQTVLAKELYEEYGNWDQVGNALIAAAKRTEIPDNDGLLQY